MASSYSTGAPHGPMDIQHTVMATHGYAFDHEQIMQQQQQQQQQQFVMLQNGQIMMMTPQIAFQMQQQQQQQHLLLQAQQQMQIHQQQQLQQLQQQQQQHTARTQQPQQEGTRYKQPLQIQSSPMQIQQQQNQHQQLMQRMQPIINTQAPFALPISNMVVSNNNTPYRAMQAPAEIFRATKYEGTDGSGHKASKSANESVEKMNVGSSSILAGHRLLKNDENTTATTSNRLKYLESASKFVKNGATLSHNQAHMQKEKDECTENREHEVPGLPDEATLHVSNEKSQLADSSSLLTQHEINQMTSQREQEIFDWDVGPVNVDAVVLHISSMNSKPPIVDRCLNRLARKLVVENRSNHHTSVQAKLSSAGLMPFYLMRLVSELLEGKFSIKTSECCRLRNDIDVIFEGIKSYLPWDFYPTYGDLCIDALIRSSKESSDTHGSWYHSKYCKLWMGKHFLVDNESLENFRKADVCVFWTPPSGEQNQHEWCCSIYALSSQFKIKLRELRQDNGACAGKETLNANAVSAPIISVPSRSHSENLIEHITRNNMISDKNELEIKSDIQHRKPECNPTSSVMQSSSSSTHTDLGRKFHDVHKHASNKERNQKRLRSHEAARKKSARKNLLSHGQSSNTGAHFIADCSATATLIESTSASALLNYDSLAQSNKHESPKSRDQTSLSRGSQALSSASQRTSSVNMGNMQFEQPSLQSKATKASTNEEHELTADAESVVFSETTEGQQLVCSINSDVVELSATQQSTNHDSESLKRSKSSSDGDDRYNDIDAKKARHSSFLPYDVLKWTRPQVIRWIHSLDSPFCEQVAEVFKKHRIYGRDFYLMDLTRLQMMPTKSTSLSTDAMKWILGEIKTLLSNSVRRDYFSVHASS